MGPEPCNSSWNSSLPDRGPLSEQSELGCFYPAVRLEMSHYVVQIAAAQAQQYAEALAAWKAQMADEHQEYEAAAAAHAARRRAWLAEAHERRAAVAAAATQAAAEAEAAAAAAVEVAAAVRAASGSGGRSSRLCLSLIHISEPTRPY